MENPATKVSAIAGFIAQRIVQGCQCQYLANFIINDQLFCVSKNSVVYQAHFISTDSKAALEIRNITQQWVLSGSAIVINGLSYKVDPNCSIVVNELGVTSCSVMSESQANSNNNQLPTVISVSVTLGGMMLLICVGLVVFSLYMYYKRKSKNHNLR